MLNKIINKAATIANSGISRIHLCCEKIGLVKKIECSVYRRHDNSIPVDFPYPLNFDKKDEALFAHYNHYQTGKEEILSLMNVNVSKEGVVFKGLNNFGPALPHPIFRAKFGWSYIIKEYLNAKRIIGSSVKTYVLIYDFWSEKNYYHWLIDTMPRLLTIKEELKRGEYTLLLPSKPAKFITATLEYFKIDNCVYIDDNEFITVDNLLIPNYLAGSGRIHPKKVMEVKEYLLSKIPSSGKYERIYVSRGRQKARKVLNEREVVNVLKQYGFETIYFEDHAFEQQVELVRNAKLVVSSHGANLTNTLFMPEGSEVLELIRNDKPNFCYWALANVVKVKYNYQLCEVKKGDNLQVDIEKLKINLISILK